MSDKILGVLAVFEEIRKERRPGDARAIPQIRTDAVQRVAYDRDVPPSTVLETIVTELKPGVTSVAALERVIDSWLNGSQELHRIMKKHVRDQIDSRAVAAFFKTPATAQAGDTTVDGAALEDAPTEESAVRETAPETEVEADAEEKPEPPRKSKGHKAAAAQDEPAEQDPDDSHEAEAAARATAEARERARAAEEAEARAREQVEAAARAAAEARAQAEAARAEAEASAKAEAEARAKAEQKKREKAEAEARRKAEAEAREKAEAEARAKAEAEARVRAREEWLASRTVVLDEDVAEFFDDEASVNEFLRAAVAPLRRKRRDRD